MCVVVVYKVEGVVCFFFFFQAEDGIRDFHVTGVQTCALPISVHATSAPWAFARRPARGPPAWWDRPSARLPRLPAPAAARPPPQATLPAPPASAVSGAAASTSAPQSAPPAAARQATRQTVA